MSKILNLRFIILTKKKVMCTINTNSVINLFDIKSIFIVDIEHSILWIFSQYIEQYIEIKKNINIIFIKLLILLDINKDYFIEQNKNHDKTVDKMHIFYFDVRIIKRTESMFTACSTFNTKWILEICILFSCSYNLLMLINISINSVENLKLIFFWINPFIYIQYFIKKFIHIMSYYGEIILIIKNQFKRSKVKLLLIEHFLFFLNCYNFLKSWIFFLISNMYLYYLNCY